MSTLVWVYVTGILVAWIIIAGWFYSSVQRTFRLIAAENQRTDAGFAITFGFIAALIWPIGIPLVYCLTGFAEHGWVKPGRKTTP